MTNYLVRLDLVTPPTTTVVDVPTMRQYMRLDSTYDDNILAAYIQAATDLVEGWIARPLIQTTYNWSITKVARQLEYPLVPVPFLVLPLGVEWAANFDFSRNIELPRNPVTAINSVSLSFWDGSPDQTLVLNQDYEVDIGNEPGRVHLMTAIEAVWNSRININFTAGYGIGQVPAPLKIAVMMLAANMYENRNGASTQMPWAVEALIASYRLWNFGSA